MAFFTLGMPTLFCRLVRTVTVSEEWHLCHLKSFQVVPFLSVGIGVRHDQMLFLIL